MSKILVSQCLLGCNCRYKGDNCQNHQIIALSKDHTLIPICPEQMGGLPTPRAPSEILGNKVISHQGQDVTEQYQTGASIAVYLAQLNHVDLAIMKSKSPSCGKGLIYDGSFSGKMIEGNGITVDKLLDHGIDVYTEEELDEILKRLHHQ